MSQALEHIASALPQVSAATPAAAPRPAPKPAEESAGGETHVRREAIEAAIREANRALEESSTSIRFSTDPDTKGIVVRVTDEATGKVVRQIPTQEELVISARLRQMVGVLFNRQA
jgi:flagellar protein FlaG